MMYNIKMYVLLIVLNCQKWLRENFTFLHFFLIHIHAFMMCRKFEPFPIKIRFFTIFKVAPKSGKSPCTIVHGPRPNFAKNEKLRILHFYIFS